MDNGKNPALRHPTTNRNFEGRQGKGSRTHLVSPAVAAATAISGPRHPGQRGGHSQFRATQGGHASNALAGRAVRGEAGHGTSTAAPSNRPAFRSASAWSAESSG